MPCTKCEEGKYKWGKTGECKYDTLDACEKANHKYSKMKPTPLGKKSYEEYEKELKEYKADEIKLSKAQKINLGIIQDGEKASEKIKTLIKQAQSQISDVTRFTGRAEDVVQIINGMRNDIKGELKKYDNALTALGEEKRDLFSTSSELQKAVQNLSNIAAELGTIEKDMGIKVPGLSEFKKLAAQGKAFDKTIENAYNKAKVPERPSQSF